MKPKFFTSFAALNGAQFFSALNDNVYKLLLIFWLIALKGTEHSNTILSLAGAVFVVPFLLFASFSGSLADRLSKRNIILTTRLMEIVIMGLGLLAFALKSPLMGYSILFLMATQSAIFSPCKYGIIPEIVARRQISHYNGVITATTYLAIILGTFLGAFLADITHRNFVLAALFCVFIAISGTLSSLGIEKTKPQSAKTKVSTRFIRDIMRTLTRSRQVRYLFPVIVFGAYFLFMGAYTQLNMIPFALQSLGLSEIHGSYLFLMTAIGIGLGSFLAGRLAGREVELGSIPLASLAISLILFALLLFASHLYVVVPLLVCLGIAGGFFVVPVDTFIQVASPPADRGQNLAAANFLSFIGVILASGLIALLGNVFELTAAQGFGIVGLLTLCVGITLMFLMADQVLRLLVGGSARFFWDLKVTGLRHIHGKGPMLLIAERTSWLDTIVVMAVLPRLIRYIVPLGERRKKRKAFFYPLLKVVSVDMEHFSPMGAPAMAEIEKELKLGHSVCLMHPVMEQPKTLQDWEKSLGAKLEAFPVPIVPIHISRTPPAASARGLAQLGSLFKHPVKVTYGPKIQT